VKILAPFGIKASGAAAPRAKLGVGFRDRQNARRATGMGAGDAIPALMTIFVMNAFGGKPKRHF